MSDDPRKILELEDRLARSSRAYQEQIAGLRAERELAEATLASIGDAVITTDAKAVVRTLNPAAEELTGWTGPEAAGQALSQILRLIEPVGGRSRDLDLKPCLEQGSKVDLTDSCTLERRDGRRLTVEGSASPIRGRDGQILGLVLTFEDVSDKQLMSLQLTRAASFDKLTGLLNREAFDKHLQRALDDATTGEEGCVLCYMGLDRFKVINETCGHAAGDLLLQWISSLIRERVRDSDVLARLAGDEFGLLLPRCPMDAAQRIAEDLHEALKHFRFIWQEKNFAVGISIGLVPIEPVFADLSDLVGAADHACFLAKEKGRGRTQVYQHDDAEIRRHHGQMNWVVKIQEALDEDLFQLYWQRIRPTFDRNRGTLFYEVLLRLRDDDGVHSPAEFMSAAERFGLMPGIDRWVVSHTLEILKHQSEEFLSRLDCCSINLSGDSLGDGKLLEFIEQELDRTGFPAHKICFEITETAAVKNLDHAVRMINRLSARDCRWALDDFGSGMSSFRYLRELPVHFIKIDGSIIRELDRGRLSRAMVQSIHQIGHVMNVETIAESVNSEAVLRELREIGVDYVQGFGIERPRPIRRRERLEEPVAAGA